ncbi:MAG: anti-sigma factor antagonist [Candidatus Omnitrophica bacterium]|jgi:anti-anti-sigma factor|nr:anti-sigma factor antagonist [Candidatus Omnitrophota bacterium]
MEIRARSKDNLVILDLSGRIDVNSANLIEAIGQCLRDGYSDILCNFEEIEFIDYMGISAIVLAYKEVINNSGRIKFTNIPAHLKNLFSVTGLDRSIDIYAEEDLAVNSFKEDKVIENIQKMQLRRRFKRLPIDIKIELKNKYATPAHCLKMDILNLSAIGAYIYGCDQFKLGDEVILKFKLPPLQEEMEIEAKVVWLSDKQVQPHIHPGIAVEFSHMPAATQSKLLEFIERNLSFMSSGD